MASSKYKPLHDHLAAISHNRWDASFEAVEKVLGFRLPKSAREYSEWWANENPDFTMHSHCKAWVLAGWKTENVNPADQKVTFVKHK